MSESPVLPANAEPAAESPATLRKNPMVWLLGLLLLTVTGGSLWQALQPPVAPPKPYAEHSLLQLDLRQPDALIETATLAKLPRDLLQIPLLRDALTEDLVFYYESNADRMGLAGALRRIAYEHELELRDSLIAELLDQPADVALWRGADGKLRHALLLLRRGALAQVLQPLAQVAASDTRLSQVGSISIDAVDEPVYRLRYNYDRSIVFVAHADRLLVLSSAELLQAGEEADSALGKIEAETLATLMLEDSPFAARFGLAERQATHRLTLSADYLAMGYGKYIPQLAGLRMEMDDGAWQSYLALGERVASDDLDFAPLWRAMPMGASACAAAPVSTAALQPLFAQLAQQDLIAAELGKQFSGPLAICWYGKSRLHTPLLVARLSDAKAPELDQQLGYLFEETVGAYEANHDEGRFPVESKQADGATLWQRVVSSNFGTHAATDFDDRDALRAAHFFRVSMARHGDTVLFSLDDTLVAQGLATLEKRYPPLGEQLPKDVTVPLYLAAESLAALLEQETLGSLPSDVEAVFRNAAESALLPKLRALGGHGRYAMTLPADSASRANWTWLPLRWDAL